MTVALLVSHADPASVNIRDRLRELVAWTIMDEHLDGLPFLRADEQDLLMFESPKLHLECDLIDRELQDATREHIDAIVVLSKHKAASGTPALTAHPIGNWNNADFGGRPRALTPSAPALMTRLLLGLAAEAKASGVRHDVTFEATHHGPHLETPTAFVEIGTDESAWSDPALGAVVARAVLEAAGGGPPLVPDEEPVLIGVGGSHYMPRATDLARKRCVAFGHFLPGYQIDAGVTTDVVRDAVARTPGASGFFVDERGVKGDLGPIVAALEEAGLRRVAADDLDARDL